MRLIIILLALMATGFLVMQTLRAPDHPTAEPRPDTSGGTVPRVPQRPQDLPRFEQEINQFVDQASRDRLRDADEAAR